VAAVRPPAAIDPVCGMTVMIDNAKYRPEYQGVDHYFVPRVAWPSSRPIMLEMAPEIDQGY
jgi:hypothetical protein